MGIPVKLEVFEGPLDLLLHLLEKNKIDIYDIPIAKITDQYMEYIYGMDKAGLEVMSEFLVIAATLLDIKCRTLLPDAPEDDGTKEELQKELADRLLQYKMYKYMAGGLKERQAMADEVLYRAPSIPAEVSEYVKPVDLDSLLDGVTLSRLNDIFREVMRRTEEKTDTVHGKFGGIRKEEIPISEKLSYIKDYARGHRRFSFRRLLEKQTGKMQVIVTFLAVLELIKSGVIRAAQEKICGDVTIDSLI